MVQSHFVVVRIYHVAAREHSLQIRYIVRSLPFGNHRNFATLRQFNLVGSKKQQSFSYSLRRRRDYHKIWIQLLVNVGNRYELLENKRCREEKKQLIFRLHLRFTVDWLDGDGSFL